MAQNFISVAILPAIQRDLFLSRCIRRVEDAPTSTETLKIEWKDMTVAFATDATVSEASVEVAEDISLPVFTRRLESLLDCGAKSEGAAEWVMKFSCRISGYGSAEEVRRILCDKVASLNANTGETIGVLKIKRRSVDAGHAKVRILPLEDSLQLIVRHTNAQGLKAVWKSVLWRLKPQYGQPKDKPTQQGFASTDKAQVVLPPGILVQGNKYYWNNYVSEVVRLGGTVNIEKVKKDGVNEFFPLKANGLQGFGRWSGTYWHDSDYSGIYHAAVKICNLSSPIPDGFSMDNEAQIVVQSRKYTEFREKALKLSQWLRLNWNLPAVPEDTNEKKPER
jgi:hypothetical protein